MSVEATLSIEPNPVEFDGIESAAVGGDWFRDPTGRVTTVVCACGAPVFYRGAIHSRLVVPENGTALCKRCKRMVRVPVIFGEKKAAAER